MNRYSDSAIALNTAMTLMVEQGDTLLAAAISHPLHLVRSRSDPPGDHDGNIPPDDTVGD